MDCSYRPWTFRTLDCSYRGLFVPSWTVRTMDYSYRPGLLVFVPWTVRTVLGLFVPWTIRTVGCSYPPGLFVPWTIRAITGRFVPCWERQHSLYSVSKKITPEVFWDFFKNGWQFSVQILHRSFIPTVDYKFLFNYLQLWRTYTILSATPSVRFGRRWTFRAWWSRLIWHNFVKVADN